MRKGFLGGVLIVGIFYMLINIVYVSSRPVLYLSASLNLSMIVLRNPMGAKRCCGIAVRTYSKWNIFYT